MNKTVVGLFLLRTVLGASALVMGVLVGMAWTGIVGLGVLAFAAIIRNPAPPGVAVRTPPWLQPLAWGGSVLLGIGLFAGAAGLAWDNYYSLMTWLIGAILLLPRGGAAGIPSPAGWRILGMLWLFIGNFIWLAEAYLRNLSADFHLGLFVALALLLLCKCLFRLPSFGVQVVNTLMLLTAGLPIIDLFIRAAPDRKPRADPGERLFAYERAKADPAGFARWCAAFDAEWQKVRRDLFGPDPSIWSPLRPIPGSRTTFFQSQIEVDSLGFRGRDVARDKGDAYRILALGESTTFGITLNREDTPWPELLEQMIRERLAPRRPVQVINAGVPMTTLKGNLDRLRIELLSLEPDLIISYHGYNGFNLIQRSRPLPLALNPPVYRARPLRLLANLEYRWRLLRARNRELALLALDPAAIARPLDTEYAGLYRELINVAQSNHIRLALCTYAMAVNRDSAPEVIRFYQRRFPSIVWSIKANEVHSAILRLLSEQHPDVLFVNAHPNPDGRHEQFIDVMHFTQEGRRQLAEVIFAGISNVLAADLSAPPPGASSPP